MEKEKLVNILMNDNVVDNINDNFDELINLIPEIKDMIGFKHNHPHHHLDVWNHTLLALSISPKNFDIRLTLLLHDIGKPHSYQDEEVRHFRGHAKKSAEIAFSILSRLNFSNIDILKLCYLIREHDTPINEEEIIYNKELANIKFKIQLCDGLAHNPLYLEKRIKYFLYINEKLNNHENKIKYKK